MKRLRDFLLHCWNILRVMRDEFACSEDWENPHGRPCCLCGYVIEDKGDLFWHGLGNCTEMTDEHWHRWEQRAEAGERA